MLAATLALAGILAGIWVKVRLEAGVMLDEARALEKEGQTELAIVVYRQTVRWYSPGSRPVADAVARLVTLGETLEAEGQPGHALLAWRALRSGLFGVRSLYQPYADQIPIAADAIARLMAQDETRTESAPDVSERQAHHRALLNIDHAPNPWWSLLAVLSFLVWVGALFGLATQAFDDATGRLLPSPARRIGLLWLVSMALWVTGLSQA